MPDTRLFNGFSEPSENYFRLPNNWFDLLNLMRLEHGDRFAAPLKMLEYILKHTWGASKFDGSVRLSTDEVRNGRRGRNRERIDAGTGLSENAIRQAGEALEKTGFITIAQNDKDKARRMKTYTIRLTEQQAEVGQESDVFKGFVPPVESYFKIPKSWTNLTRATNSASTIVVVEYLIRHAWGFQNPDGEWLTADEIANGRRYETSGKRYDNGVGFEITTVYRGLNEAISLGLVVFVEEYETGTFTRKFNLHLHGMHVDSQGRWIEAPICTNEEVDSANEEGNGTTDTQPICTNDEVICTNEDVNGAKKGVVGAIAARSVKDTSQNTKEKHSQKTLSTAAIKKSKMGDHAGDELPDEILSGLARLKWSDTLTEVVKYFRQDRKRVQAWLSFSLRATGVKNRAGLYRKGLRSGTNPPYEIALPTLLEIEEEINAESQSDQPESFAPECLDPGLTKSWNAVLEQLKQEMPHAAFDAWVQDTYPIELDNCQLTIAAKDPAACDWLESRLGRTIERLLIGILKQEVEVVFVSQTFSFDLIEETV